MICGSAKQASQVKKLSLLKTLVQLILNSTWPHVITYTVLLSLLVVTVERSLSDHPECEDLVVANGR